MSQDRVVAAGWLSQIAGRSEMGTRVARCDWDSTSLGAADTWTPEVRCAVQICLSTRFPVLIAVGVERICIYNDAYAQILGSAKHPEALGSPAAEVWSEIWQQISPDLDRLYETGVPSWSEDERLVIDRHGFSEECFFRRSFGAIHDDRGDVNGVMDIVTETTSSVLAQRRLRCLTDLNADLAKARSVTDVSLGATVALERWHPAVRAADVYLRVDDKLILAASNRRSGPTAKATLGAAAGLRHEAASPQPSDRPVVSVTLPVGGESTGAAVGAIVLTLNDQRPFDAQYVEFVELVAASIGAALDRTRRHDIEVDEYRRIGDTLQQAMLEPASDFRTVAARYLPATGNLAVGGDWYDVIQLPTGNRGLVVGDCVGHGLDAAAAMSQLRTATRSMLLQGLSPAEALRALNRFSASVDGAFNATAVCMVVDPARGELTWARAGHPYPLVVSADGVVWLDDVGGPPLGLMAEPDYQDAVRQLGLDDLIILYSDGLIERRGESIDDGFERLERAAAGFHGRAAEEVVEHLVETLLPATPRDDVVVVVKQVPLEHTVPTIATDGDPRPGTHVTSAPPVLRSGSDSAARGAVDSRRFEHQLRLRPEALADARTRFQEWLTAHHADVESVSDLTVVLSELAANAINAGVSGSDQHGQIRAWCNDDVITLEVENSKHSSAVSSVVIHTDNDPLRGGGQGLGIVAAFVDSVEILPPSGTSGLLVRCQRRVPGLRC